MGILTATPNRLVYVYNSLLPSPAANSVHVMNFCEALADQGFKVTLLTQTASSPIDKEELYKYYGVKSNFDIVTFNVHWLPIGRQLVLALLSVFFILRNRIDLVYGRSILGVGLSAICTSVPTIFEIHNLIHQRTRLERILFYRLLRQRNLLKIVVITKKLQEDFAKELSDQTTLKKFVVLPDCATRRDLSDAERITLSGDYKVNIGYTGSLYKGKGADFVIKIASALPEYAFHVVGGNKEQIANLAKRAGSNVFFYGFQPNRKIPYFIINFDICLLPNELKVFGHGSDKVTSTEDIGKYTSPLKLFEYMAYGRAIIASDIPVLREVINEKTCIFANVGDVNDWRNKIHLLVNGPKQRDVLAKNAAQEFLRSYSWQKRASTIAQFFEQSQTRS